MNKTYYDILGISINAREREIKQAYRKMARNLHPDKARDKEDREKKEKMFADISEAYNVLKNKKKRADYDQKLKLEKAKSSFQNKEHSSHSFSSGPKGLSKERNMIAKKAYTRGIQIMKKGNYLDSVTFFKAAIENDNSKAIYYYRLAMSMMMAKKSFTKAVEYCNEALKKDPYNMDYKLLMGEIYEKAGGISKAKKIYEEILRWDKTNYKAKENLKRLGFSIDGKSKSFFVNLLEKIGLK